VRHAACAARSSDSTRLPRGWVRSSTDRPAEYKADRWAAHLSRRGPFAHSHVGIRAPKSHPRVRNGRVSLATEDAFLLTGRSGLGAPRRSREGSLGSHHRGTLRRSHQRTVTCRTSMHAVRLWGAGLQSRSQNSQPGVGPTCTKAGDPPVQRAFWHARCARNLIPTFLEERSARKVSTAGDGDCPGPREVAHACVASRESMSELGEAHGESQPWLGISPLVDDFRSPATSRALREGETSVRPPAD